MILRDGRFDTRIQYENRNIVRVVMRTHAMNYLPSEIERIQYLPLWSDSNDVFSVSIRTNMSIRTISPDSIYDLRVLSLGHSF